MKRRPFLATVGGASVTALAGCLEGDPVVNVNESVRIEPMGGEWWEVEDIDGPAEVGYTVQSETHTFQAFYFTTQAEFELYQSYIAGQDVDGQPDGHDEFSMLAVPDENGVYEARRPPDGGRLEIEIEERHYFVVDYSNYNQDIGVKDHDDPLQATVNFEVVEDQLF